MLESASDFLKPHVIVVKRKDGGHDVARSPHSGLPVHFRDAQRAAKVASSMNNRTHGLKATIMRSELLHPDHNKPKFPEKREAPPKTGGVSNKPGKASPKPGKTPPTKRGPGILGAFVAGIRGKKLREARMPEAPPRTGLRKGIDRRKYDILRHNWRMQALSKVIDDEFVLNRDVTS